MQYSVLYLCNTVVVVVVVVVVVAVVAIIVVIGDFMRNTILSTMYFQNEFADT